MEIGVGSYISIVKDTTTVTGLVDGIKVNEQGLERISFTGIDIWFWMSDGWLFMEESEDE